MKILKSTRINSFGLIPALMVIILVACLRLVNLGADAPVEFPNGFRAMAPVKDEAAKGYASRNKALFGEWYTSEKDQYRFWEVLSPVWIWMLWLWFKVAGVGYYSYRIFSVLWSALTVIGFFLCLGRFRYAGLLAGVIFALNFYTIIYGRLGLMETTVNGLLVLSFACLLRVIERPVWIFPSAFLWLACWFTKQSAAVYLPVFFTGAIMISRPFTPGVWRRPESRAAFLVFLAAVILAVWPFLFGEYRFRTSINFCQLMGYRQDCLDWLGILARDKIRPERLHLWTNMTRGYLVMFPVAGSLALIEIFIVIYKYSKGERPSSEETLLIFWWLLARFALIFQGRLAPRFWLIQVPPVMMLAGIALHRILTFAPSSARWHGIGRLRWAAVAGVLIFCTAYHLIPWAHWVRENPRSIEKGTTKMIEAIGEIKAVVIGEWAPPLCFDTPYKYYYVKTPFNTSPEQLESFGITHILIENEEDAREPSVVISFRKAFPEAYEAMTRLDEIVLLENTRTPARVVLYSVETSAR